MATLSSVLAWRIPWTEEPGWLQSMRWQRVRHEWAHTHTLLCLTIILLLILLYFLWLHNIILGCIQSVQSLSRVQLFVTPWTATRQASLSITNSQSLLKLMSIVSVMPFNHLILCHPFIVLPSIFPSIRVFSNESVLHIRWPKYWSFSFSISPSNEYSGLISFRMDWLDLLDVQGTIKNLLQHHSLKVSVLRCSALFIVQLSHLYMTTGKIIALTRQAFVDKVMSLLFNTLSRFVIAFLLRSKRQFHGYSYHLQRFWSPRK